MPKRPRSAGCIEALYHKSRRPPLRAVLASAAWFRAAAPGTQALRTSSVCPPSKPSAAATSVCVDASLDLALQKQAPTYGAIPSAADLKKQKDDKEDEAAWKEDVAYKLLHALLRLNKLEQANPAKVSTCLRSPDTPCLRLV